MIGVASETPAASAIELIFSQRWRAFTHFMARVGATQGKDDAEMVHRLRIAARRIEAIGDAFSDRLPGDTFHDLFGAVAQIRKACGGVRDHDVRLELLKSLIIRASPRNAIGLAVLCWKIAVERRRARRRLGKKLCKLHAPCQRLARAAAGEMAAAAAYSTTCGDTFGALGLRAVRQSFDRLWRRVTRRKQTARRLHELRIRCKTARYTLETVAGVVHEQFREEVYPQLQELQYVLGAYHDAIAMGNLLHHMRRQCLKAAPGRWTRRRQLRRQWLRRGIDAALSAVAKQATRAHAEFQQRRATWASSAFREALDERLARTGSVEFREEISQNDDAAPAEPEPIHDAGR